MPPVLYQLKILFAIKHHVSQIFEIEFKTNSNDLTTYFSVQKFAIEQTKEFFMGLRLETLSFKTVNSSSVLIPCTCSNQNNQTYDPNKQFNKLLPYHNTQHPPNNFVPQESLHHWDDFLLQSNIPQNIEKAENFFSYLKNMLQ